MLEKYKKMNKHIAFVQTMLNDDSLTPDDKIELLQSFREKTHNLIAVTIMDNLKVQEMAELLNFITGEEKLLKSTTDTL